MKLARGSVCKCLIANDLRIAGGGLRKSLIFNDLRLEFAASGNSKNHANPLRGWHETMVHFFLDRLVGAVGFEPTAKGSRFNQRLNPVEPESADLVFAFAHLANEAGLLALGEQGFDDFDGVEIQTGQSLFLRLGGSVKNLDGFRLGEQGFDVFDDVHVVYFSYLVTGKL
jgi:hypothetical protein